MAKQTVQIAAQLFTVRAFTRAEEGIAASLRRVKESGYDCVQISAFGPCSAEFLRGELEKNGLTVCATHTPYERIVKDTDNVIREHKMIGCPYVGLGYCELKTPAQVRAFLADVLPAAEKIRDAGLKFLYHNHQFEFCRMENGASPMQMLLSETSADTFGLLPDLYWLQFAGVDPVRFLHENADRIGVVHLKDMIVTADGAQRFAEIYEGNMNYDGIGRALGEIGVRYAAVEQDDCYGRDPFACLERSRGNIRKHWEV